MNRFEMFLAMLNGTVTTVQGPNRKVTGLIQGITREDGSGHNFLVKMLETDKFGVALKANGKSNYLETVVFVKG